MVWPRVGGGAASFARGIRAIGFPMAAPVLLVVGCGGRVTITEPDAGAQEGALVADNAWDPYVAPDGAGGGYVAYSREGTTCATEELWVQHMSADGERLWPPDGVRVSGAESCASGAIRSRAYPDGEGGVFVVWETPAEPWDLPAGDWFVQRVAPDGLPMWPSPVRVNGALSPGTGGGPGLPGELWIAWNEVEDGVDGCDARLQRLGPDGSPAFTPALAIAGDFSLGCMTETHGTRDGALVVYFQEWPMSGEFEVWMNVYERDGSPRWPASVSLGRALVPDLYSTAELPSGEFLSASDAFPGNEYYGQILAVSDGGMVLGSTPVEPAGYSTVIDGAGDGRSSVAWAGIDDSGRATGLLWVQGWSGLADLWAVSLRVVAPLFLAVTATPDAVYVSWYDTPAQPGPGSAALWAAAWDWQGAQLWGPIELSHGSTYTGLQSGYQFGDGAGGAVTSYSVENKVWFQILRPGGPALGSYGATNP